MAKSDNEYKYGVKNLAKDLGIDAAYVRTKLRSKKIAVNKDGVYGWNSQSDYKAVVAKLKPADKKTSAKAPAKKVAAKKVAKAA